MNKRSSRHDKTGRFRVYLLQACQTHFQELLKELKQQSIHLGLGSRMAYFPPVSPWIMKHLLERSEKDIERRADRSARASRMMQTVLFFWRRWRQIRRGWKSPNADFKYFIFFRRKNKNFQEKVEKTKMEKWKNAQNAKTKRNFEIFWGDFRRAKRAVKIPRRWETKK